MASTSDTPPRSSTGTGTGTTPLFPKEEEVEGTESFGFYVSEEDDTTSMGDLSAVTGASTPPPPPPHPMHHNHRKDNPFDAKPDPITHRDTQSLLAPSKGGGQRRAPLEVECVKCGHRNRLKGNEGGRGGHQHAVDVGMEDGVYLTWDDLWVTVSAGKNGSTTILEGSTGFAEPGRLLAIMGPSGSGKTTLLDALAGRLASNTRQSGRILVNGRKQALAYGTSAYVTQDDILMTTLTVREAVYYSAQLQLPTSMSKSEKWDRAEAVIREMGLQDAMDTRIGSESSRGLSGGQKRRVSICLEILMRSWLLFMDEPTSGLDSAASFHVMNRIARLARLGGRTIVVSIHQPSSEVFGLFDDLCLLTYGKTVYFGTAASAGQFFGKNGFACPPLKNPADHYLRTINKDFEQETEDGYSDDAAISTVEAINTLVTSFKSSEYSQQLLKRVAEINKVEGVKLKKGSQSGFLNHCVVLTRRSMVNMSRDIGYYWLRFGIYLMIAVCLGTVFYQLDHSYSSIADRGSVLMFVAGFLTFMTIGGFPSFVEDIKIFQRERLNGHYGVASYVIGHTLSSAPFLFLVSVIPGVISYYLVGLQKSFDHFVYFALVLYACMILVESLMMMVASIVPNFIMGIITGAGIQGLMMLTGGFFRLPDDIPKPVWKYPFYHIAFDKYADQGFCKNEFIGLTFSNKDGQFPPTVTGLEVIRDYFQMEIGYSKWVDLGVLFGMVVVYRLLFFLFIKIREKFIPMMKAVKGAPK